MLGNQVQAETPAGFQDESFTFFSPPISVPAGGTNYGNALIIPGGDDVVIKNVEAFVTFTGGLFAVPTLQIRLPNGYSLTGGDWSRLTSGRAVLPFSPRSVWPTAAG